MKSFFFSLLCLSLYYCPDAYASGGESSPAKIVFVLVNFMIFLYALYYFLFGKTAGFFNLRGESISRDVEDASSAKKSAMESFENMNAKLEGVASEIKRLSDETVMQGERIKKDALETARRRGQMIVSEGQYLISAETKRIVDHLRKNLAKASVDLAEAKIKNRLGKKEHSRLIDECIDEIGEAR